MAEQRKIDWFHGAMGREESEAVLKEHGFDEGLFLVRESSTSLGDFVLSVVHDNDVIHYQIRRRQDQDGLFSLSEEKKVIHGLDELVYYYQYQLNSGLQHRLINHVPGSECPSAVRLHGTENLLHRATAGGSVPVVSELLKCGYRNIAAKDHDGQCAIHLAAFFGHIDVLDLLIEHGASANVANSSGYTPLHVAMQSNKPVIAQRLLEGGANPTIRNQITGWVPLHEAAWNGNIDCAKILLQWDAPVMSRTPKDETPADLALANGQNQMCELLNRWIWPAPTSNYEDWLHPASVTRTRAIQMLSDYGSDDGTFLIRKSSKKSNCLVISMCCDKTFFHFEIEKRGIYFFLDQGPYMVSLEHLVDHYMRFSDGLPIQIRNPLSIKAQLPPKVPSPSQALIAKQKTKKEGTSPTPTSSSSSNNSLVLSDSIEKVSPLPPRDMPKPKMSDISPVTNDSPSPELPPRLPPSRDPRANTNYPTNLKPIVRRKKYENNETLRRVRHSRDAIPMESLELGENIGEGEFGSVHKAVYMTEEGEEKSVAVKVIQNSGVDDSSPDFIQEANVMMNLDHQCIVRLIGISSGPPVLVVLELVPLGSMLDFLIDHPAAVRMDMELPLWAAQIACGMVYLENQRFIHRDLAARNILLASKLQAKISDFGLSRVINSDKEYYRASKGGRWPIKWYAPECFNYGTFSHASDVWSYGVLLWEMYTKGKQPYDGMRGDEVVAFVEKGKRLPLPTEANFEVRNIIECCWEYSPDLRPQFSELLKFFSENPAEYSNLKELLTNQDLGQLGR